MPAANPSALALRGARLLARAQRGGGGGARLSGKSLLLGEPLSLPTLPAPRGGRLLSRAHAGSSEAASRDTIPDAHRKQYALQAVGRAGSTTSTTCTGHAIRTDLPRAMGGHDEAPQPVELLLASLVGCEQATASFVARQMRPRLPLAEIQFLYRAERDNRGAVALPLGDAPPEVPARLSRVHGVATVTLNDGESETRERVEYLRRQVELRCPVANMMAAAGIELDIEWVLAAEDACGQ